MQKVSKTLPLCDSCGVVMAPEYGFMESFAKTVGGYDICGYCYRELREKGFLYITARKYLMRSGKIKKKEGVDDDDEFIY